MSVESRVRHVIDLATFIKIRILGKYFDNLSPPSTSTLSPWNKSLLEAMYTLGEMDAVALESFNPSPDRNIGDGSAIDYYAKHFSQYGDATVAVLPEILNPFNPEEKISVVLALVENPAESVHDFIPPLLEETHMHIYVLTNDEEVPHHSTLVNTHYRFNNKIPVSDSHQNPVNLELIDDTFTQMYLTDMEILREITDKSIEELSVQIQAQFPFLESV